LDARLNSCDTIERTSDRDGRLDALFDRGLCCLLRRTSSAIMDFTRVNDGDRVFLRDMVSVTVVRIYIFSLAIDKTTLCLGVITPRSLKQQATRLRFFASFRVLPLSFSALWQYYPEIFGMRLSGSCCCRFCGSGVLPDHAAKALLLRTPGP